MEELAKNYPLIAAVVGVIILLVRAVPAYDKYNKEKARDIREAEESVLEKERQRVAAETARQLAEEEKWDAKLALVQSGFEATIKSLRAEIEGLRARIKQHEHVDRRQRHTMYIATVNLSTIPGTEQVRADLLAAAGLEPGEEPK